MLADASGRELTMPADRLARLLAALANGLAMDALVDVDVDADADAQALLGDGFALLWAAATRPRSP